MKHIIVLGGSYSGISTAHRILKQSARTGPIKVTLISPNTDLYWSIASPRGLIPEEFNDEQLFQPIAAGFSHYPAGQFEFILASAEHIDVEEKRVAISSSKSIGYDFLILATGSSAKGGAPFKGLESTEATKDALHKLQMQVAIANTIAVAGAGPTGVETAGELGFKYGTQKKIILIASGPVLLEGRPASLSDNTMKHLQGLNVDIKLQTKVKGSATTSDGRQELVLSGGVRLIADLYLPTFGLTPNSSYLPAKFVNAEEYVIVDEYLKLKGAEDIWAIGDVSEVDPPQFLFSDYQSVYTTKSIVSLLNNKAITPYKASKTSMIGLQIGKKIGIGHFGGMRIPGFVVSMLRKTLFVERLETMVNGSAF